MATYKQKLPRVQHVERDSEESEQEWVMFNTSNKPIERRLVNNVSEDEDWHVLSDTSLVEEGIPTFESNSEFASGGSDYDSEHFVQDENTRSIESFIRKMPSHDGTGNFFNATPSDGSNHDHIDYASSYSDQDNESLSRDLKRSIISNNETSQNTRRTNSPIHVGRDSQKSWITKFRNVFRGEEDETTQASQQIYHKFAESASSTANFELGDLGDTNPIKVLTNVANETANSTTYTTVTTQYIDSNQSSQTNHVENLPAPMVHLFDSPSSASSASSSNNVIDGPRTEKHASIITRFSSRLIMPKDPMDIKFAPTISKDMLNEMITENANSVDHQKQQSQTSSQSDKNSLLSTVWTTFCRITNNIIVPDDTDSTNLAFNHNTHNIGLASIITGDNHYDTCYPPFGNHLTLSELWPSLHSHKSHNHYSSSSTPSTSSHNKRRNSITSSSNTARIFLTPVSSSTSLKSFTSRAGSDCGLESGRGIGRSTIIEATLVL